ncbi:GM12063 [Drosophila sechellia]|uniref:GM12063 n=1 Tax=Drosophila sechellia TaxID=7238 RepID=B4IJA8_DROSE|nr:GM12063 [Drosophila sechellia]
MHWILKLWAPKSCGKTYVLSKNSGAGTGGAHGDDSEQGQDSKHESKSSSFSSSGSATASTIPQPRPRPVPPHHRPPTTRPPSGVSQGHLLTPGLECLEFRFEGGGVSKVGEVVQVGLEAFGDGNGNASSIGGSSGGIGGGGFAPCGSVTKMTLKDNHLIVVTEERHDISRNARETKMHTDKDGVFVVEVARGIDSKQLTGDHSGVTLDSTELPFDNKLAPNGGHLLEKTLPSHEQVQIHAPPQDFATGHPAPLHLIEEAEEHVAEDLSQQAVETPSNLARTGLSQSDLSSTSSSDSNKRYSYGNQELYVIEQPGYATSSPTAKPILISPNQNSGQDLEQKSQLSTSTEQTEIDSSQGTKKSDEEVARQAEAVKEVISEKEVANPPQKEVDTPPEYEVKATPIDVKQEEPVVPEKLTAVQPIEEEVVSRKEEEVPPKEELPPPTVEVSPPKEDQVPIENKMQEQEEKADNQVEVQTESSPDPTDMNAKLPDESLKPEETTHKAPSVEGVRMPNYEYLTAMWAEDELRMGAHGAMERK